MLNRLKEIKKEDDYSDDENVENGVNENSAELQAKLQEFYADVKLITDSFEKMQTNVLQIRKTHEESLRATNATTSKNLKAKIGKLVDETRGASKEIKTTLEKIESETKDKRNADGYTAEVRLRETQHSQLMRRFVDYLKDFQTVQDQIKKESKDRIHRNVKIVNPEATEDEIEELIQKSKLTEADVFKPGLTQSQKHTLESYYAEVSETHRDIIELEAQFRELHELFLDFAALVNQQDELIDNIELQVSKAAEYVEKGRENLVKSRKISHKTRYIAICIIIVVIIAFVVFFVILVVAIPAITCGLGNCK